MFQAGGLVVVLVEVNRKAYLASIVPVIVNAILNEHQIISDIVAFVNKGDFPRSRLGEKQRGKILAGWVTRKMRTVAQFAIRDVDLAAMGQALGAGVEGGDPNRASVGSGRSLGLPTAGATSLRNLAPAPQILEQEEFEQQMDHIANMTPAANHMGLEDNQITPTEQSMRLDSESSSTAAFSSRMSQSQDFGAAGPKYGLADSRLSSQSMKPGSRAGDGQVTPQIKLPSVDGREHMWLGGGKGDEDDWQADAIMHMNLMGGDPGRK